MQIGNNRHSTPATMTKQRSAGTFLGGEALEAWSAWDPPFPDMAVPHGLTGLQRWQWPNKIWYSNTIGFLTKYRLYRFISSQSCFKGILKISACEGCFRSCTGIKRPMTLYWKFATPAAPCNSQVAQADLGTLLGAWCWGAERKNRFTNVKEKTGSCRTSLLPEQA